MLSYASLTFLLFAATTTASPLNRLDDIQVNGQTRFALQTPSSLVKTSLVTILQSLSVTVTATATATASPSSNADSSVPLLEAGANAVLFLPHDAYHAQSPSNATDAPLQPSGKTRPLVMAYYPDWAAASFPPERIDFARFDWIDFAFALPNSDFEITWDDPQAPLLLRRLVTIAHAHNKKVKLSVGGWTGSKWFSPAVATPQSRQLLVANILSLYSQYNLDGIDIDWEYPGQSGYQGNKVSPSDTANFLVFLRLLRSALPPSAAITAAVLPEPFAGSDGNPSANVSDFAQVLDWVLIMNYDIWGSSARPGPNAPLYNACHNSSQPSANAVSAFETWTAAGFSPSQLVLGVPSYGYISQSTATTLQTRAVPRDDDDESAASDNGAVSSGSSGSSGSLRRRAASQVRVNNDDGGSEDGQVQFRSLVAQGALVRTNVTTSGEHSPRYVGGGGFERHWDACSGTPFLRSAPAGQVITYDDPESLGAKAAFAARMGMRGVNMFDVHGDVDEWALIDGVRAQLGLS